jgi:NAD(P)-dependent dehydrogenase (short-subunit alcohol dehydrogenase family)
MALLKDKVALVTGGARGIGEGISTVFAEQGAHVAVVDMLGDQAESVVGAIQAAGGPEAMSIQCNVTDPDDVQRAVEAAVERFGRVDVLVNNAGIIRNHTIVDFPLEDWQAVFKVNVEGTFLCTQAVARQMIAQGDGGAIVNISSCAANKADLKHAAYSATKAAVISFTRISALELGQYGIRANAILPGATGPTPMLEAVFANVPGIEQELIAKTTLGKLATPRDQANAAVFLASDMAGHITGEYLVVAGGEFMNA